MGHENITEFSLLGHLSHEDMKAACFVLFSLCYLAILLGNLLILLTIRRSHLSEQQIYFFLSYLSFMDICFTSTVAPKLTKDLLAQWKTISYKSYMAQMFYTHFFGGTGIFILVVMAYDHYAAICRHLHYMIMSRHVCYVLVMVSVSGAFIHSLIHVLNIIELPLCGPNQVDHYFFHIFPLLTLPCTDSSLLAITIITTTGVMYILTFVALVISCIVILSALRTRSSDSHCRALSTCGSHIIVVLMFFLPLTFTYVPMADSVSDRVLTVLFYTMVAPMFTPLIYMLRNTDMKNAMKKVWCQDKLFERKHVCPI